MNKMPFEQIPAITFAQAVLSEVSRAQAKHAPIHSYHEGYAVILEEVDELWDLMKLQTSQRDPKEVRKELIHIAAMAIRMAVDLGLEQPNI